MQEQVTAWTRALVLAVSALLSACGTPGSAGRSTPSRLGFDHPMSSASCVRHPALCARMAGEDAVLEPLVTVATVGATLHAAMKALDPAMRTRLEEVLVECAKQAEFQVNEQWLGPGQRPTPAQCEEVVEQDSHGNPVTWGMKRGADKHRLALQCVENSLEKMIPGQFSLQQRYRYEPATAQLSLITKEQVAELLAKKLAYTLRGTLEPDIVLHEGDPLRPKLVYDYKFPCPGSKPARWRTYTDHPLDVPNQQVLYRLALRVEPVLLTPFWGRLP